MRFSGRRASLLLAAPIALMMAQPSYAQTRSDPWERMNRGFFAIEQAFDQAIIGPIARGLGKTPSPIRAALRNFTRNLGEPTVAVNDLLQGHVGTAASTVGRFAINSIFGVAGIADVAKSGGIPHHDNDFGMTLGRWGVGPGPYLFLPLVGPTTVRDSVGGLADIGLDPLSYVHYRNKRTIGIATTVLDGLTERVDAARDLQAVEETSTDPYATIRSYYLQDREHEITGKEPELQDLPDLGPDPGAASAPPPPDAAPPAQPETAPQSSPQSAPPAPVAQPSPSAPDEVPAAPAAEPDAAAPMATAGGGL